MPEYKLSILVEAAENGASDVLGRLSGGLGALNVAMGNLIADGLKAATGALVEFGRQGLAVATDYQSSLNMFQAVSGATGDQMAAIAAEAKRLGGDMSLPATSAGDAARAMTELAKAGLSVDNALKAGKGTLQLAAAGNLDEAQAAEIAANALNSFGLAGDKAAMVADLFAAAANKSSLEVTDVADGFKMASAVFAAFQGPVVGSEKALKDLTTAMALLGNVGIKGSEAGTSLKQMLLQLSGPSSTAKDAMAGLMYNAMGASGGIAQLDTILGGKAKDRTDALKALAAANPDIAKMGDIAYDSAGKMRPLQEIIRLVTLGTKNLNDEQRNQALTTIFGADATRAIIGLMKAGPEAFAAMEQSIAQQGAAADLAGARMKGLGGAWEGFKSILETVQLSVMEPLLGPLEQGVRAFADAVSSAQPMLVGFVNTSVVPAVEWLGRLLTGFIAAPDKLGFLGRAMDDIAGKLGRWGAELLPLMLDGLSNVFKGAVSFASEHVPTWIAALAPLGAALVDWIEPQIPPLLEKGGKLLDRLGGWVEDSAPIFAARLSEKWGPMFWNWVTPQISPLQKEAGKFGQALLDWIGDQGLKIGPKLGDWTIQLINWAGPAIGELIVAAGKAFGSFIEWIGGSNTTGDLSKGLTAWTAPFVSWAATELAPALIKALINIGSIVWGALGELWKDAWANGTRGGALLDALGEGKSLNDAMHIAQIPGFASGVTNFSGGLAYVHAGELLTNMAPGTSVIPAGATRDMLGGGGGGGGGGLVWNGDIIVNGAQDPKAVAREVREELLKLGKRNLNIFGGYA